MAELGNTLWNNAELQAFAADANRQAYQKSLDRAKEDFKRHNESIYKDLNPVEAVATWIVNGMSGQGNEGDYLKTHGFTDDVQKAGEAGMLDENTLNALRQDTESNITSEMNKGTGATMGLRNTPVIGGILDYMVSPVSQLAGAGRDLSEGIGEGKWDDWENRDKLSDLGALGQTAAMIATPAIGNPATIGGKVGLGAALGGADSAFDTLRTQGENVNINDLLSSSALGAGIGAAIPVAGNIAGKVGQRGEKYLANEALARGIANNATDAAQIAKNTGRATKARAAFSSLPKWGKIGLVGGAATAGGASLANLLNSNANSQTGYDDEAVYGSDKYGTTQGYNYGTYGY